MYISDKAWNKYISMLRKTNEKAAEEMFSYLAHHNWWTSRAEKQAAIDFAFGLATKYGEAASAAACEFYDEIADAWAGHSVAPAVPAKTATYGEVAKAINGTGKTLNEKMMSDAVGRLVKMAGVDTTMQNALRDGAEWAWIPRGDTCPFCLTLASRGWQEASEKAIKNGHAEHIHANCDCTYAVRFSPDQNVEGYDPEEYRELYYSAEGDTPEEKINSMRRIKYGMDKDRINEQKRAAYNARTGEERLRRVHFGNKAVFESDFGDIAAVRIKNTGNNLSVAEGVTLKRKEVREADRLVSTAKDILNIRNDCKIPVVIMESDSRLAAYNPRTNILYISKQLTDPEEARKMQQSFSCPDNPNSTLVHELLHWKDAEDYRRNIGTIEDAKQSSEYSRYQQKKAKKALTDNGVDLSDPLSIYNNISYYAYKKLLANNYEEVYTEYRTKAILER